ncbi:MULTISPECIES: UbiD family decarboxylase [unclassified Fibrobacter]|uniref:UbiD family decarboxylase n=1 Tax=unclassified Fibrobacter TaxID=2634177 RepID=UPI00091C8A56|nr:MULTISPECIES: UbiD family decarboxylase [unclassified Fibrobacter]OWV06890.1 3-octaprenyl-4-hydroxybenzoate carboxy-lyase [Fibrobacter sp. UWH3]SHK20481.1 4-hydroxy-3-polyprenylbenzoate decarboxylase [Fibrobacter sp. UWH6]
MYKSLEQALLDLEKAGMLKRIHQEVDPNLEMAEIARQVFENNGPALLFEKVKGSPFRAACNIFGTQERLDFLFRKTIKGTQTAVQFKSNPVQFFKNPNPVKLLRAACTGINALPRRSGSIKDFEECTLADLPQIKSWPLDGGAFITLPQVATRPSENASVMTTNVGMYRIQISGNEYVPNEECGLHYQIKRDIARHHRNAIEENRPLKVSIFIGGTPAQTVAAVMPMPENLSELVFAGMLGGRRFRYFIHDGYLISSDADFCILGEMEPELKPEGPFGDHIGYYSDKHDFPCLKVKKVLCKKNAIYPFTVVGRPPKEDTLFGSFIHQITKPMVPASIPGLHAIHAVDDAGVHPLCLALASERFVPYAKEREPMELLKTANAILGFNQASLSKYLLIAAKEDNANLNVNDVPAFFAHVLERLDFSRDLHFQTATTIDTLDYTGGRLNHGSKLIMAAAGEKRRNLRHDMQDIEFLQLPDAFTNSQGKTSRNLIKMPMAGVLIIQAPAFDENEREAIFMQLESALDKWEFRENYPWISIVDQVSEIDNERLDGSKLPDFLWLTFTRSDPARDIFGLQSFIQNKHWGCHAPIIVDARVKPHHQKSLTIPNEIKKRAAEILKQEL